VPSTDSTSPSQTRARAQRPQPAAGSRCAHARVAVALRWLFSAFAAPAASAVPTKVQAASRSDGQRLGHHQRGQPENSTSGSSRGGQRQVRVHRAPPGAWRARRVLTRNRTAGPARLASHEARRQSDARRERGMQRGDLDGDAQEHVCRADTDLDHDQGERELREPPGPTRVAQRQRDHCDRDREHVPVQAMQHVQADGAGKRRRQRVAVAQRERRASEPRVVARDEAAEHELQHDESRPDEHGFALPRAERQPTDRLVRRSVQEIARQPGEPERERVPDQEVARDGPWREPTGP
jgi:hypothetical protein